MKSLIEKAAKELLARRSARQHLLDFTLYTFPNYQVAWFHRLLCQYLDAFIAGNIKRLMVFMPPRTGKSELVSRRLPSFLLGHNPDLSIIATSYGSELARRMNRDVQRIIDSPEYRVLFPDSKLFGQNVRTTAQGTWLRNSDMFEVVGYKGYYLSTGVGGAITGSGADVAIIDDPIKNRKEADSPTYRRGVYEWFTSTLYTRLSPQGQILLTVTRWHEDDLAGRLLWASDNDPDAEKWTVVRLPAIAEAPIPEYDIRSPEDALWEQRWPLKKLMLIKASVGSRDWNSLYQQRPTAEEGNIFRKQDWNYWAPKGKNLPPVLVPLGDGKVKTVIPVELPDDLTNLVQSWDLNFKDVATSDFVAGLVMGMKGADRFFLDYTMERYSITQTMEIIRTWSIKWPKATAKLIEDAANGPAVVSLLKHEIPGLILRSPQGGKVSRAFAVQPLQEAGNLYLPHPLIAPWVNSFIANAASFPNGANDDDIDAATQGLIYYQDHTISYATSSSSSKVVSREMLKGLFG